MFEFPVYPSSIYAIAYTISFWSWFLFEMWVFYRDRRLAAQTPRGSPRWHTLAIVLAISVAVNIPLFFRSFDIQGAFAPYFILALVLIWAGLLFRFWAIQTLGSLFSTRLVIQQQHELITRGPYTHLRNPSYTGAVVTFAGIGLGTGNLLSLAFLLIAVAILYVMRIRVEDRLLGEAFGEAYAAYKKRSWALIPYVW